MDELNGKVGWIIAAVVVVLAVLAYAVYDSTKAHAAGISAVDSVPTSWGDIRKYYDSDANVVCYFYSTEWGSNPSSAISCLKNI